MHQRDGNWICLLLTLLWMVLVLCLSWTHVWCLLGCFYFSNFFSGNQGLCLPNLTLQSVDWASTLSSSKYFPAHSFLMATGLPEAGFQLYWMYGKLMTALVSVQWRSSLFLVPLLEECSCAGQVAQWGFSSWSLQQSVANKWLQRLIAPVFSLRFVKL